GRGSGAGCGSVPLGFFPVTDAAAEDDRYAIDRLQPQRGIGAGLFDTAAVLAADCAEIRLGPIAAGEVIVGIGNRRPVVGAAPPAGIVVAFIFGGAVTAAQRHFVFAVEQRERARDH